MAKVHKGGGFTDKSAKGLNEAVSHSHGQFRAKAEAAGMSTAAYAKKEEDAPGKLGKQARLAETLMGMHHGGSKASKLYGKKSVKRG